MTTQDKKNLDRIERDKLITKYIEEWLDSKSINDVILFARGRLWDKLAHLSLEEVRNLKSPKEKN